MTIEWKFPHNGFGQVRGVSYRTQALKPLQEQRYSRLQEKFVKTH